MTRGSILSTPLHDLHCRLLEKLIASYLAVHKVTGGKVAGVGGVLPSRQGPFHWLWHAWAMNVQARLGRNAMACKVSWHGRRSVKQGGGSLVRSQLQV